MEEVATEMDTKSLIIEIATRLFQQKGYEGVGLNQILKVCYVTKGSFYHHFPNGKEELLIARLQLMEEAITRDIEDIFNQCQTTQEAIHAMIEKLVDDFLNEKVRLRDIHLAAWLAKWRL
jgi:TetR/AcrR family transcriptional repressor of lmrAB and yxaGH operons